MKTKVYSILALAAGVFAMHSCKINEDYDLDKFDDEVTVLEGMKINVSEETELSIGEILGSEGSPDSDGTSVFRSRDNYVNMSISSWDLRQANTHSIHMPLGSSAPEFIALSQGKLLFTNPVIEVDITNPFPEDILSDLTFYSGSNTVLVKGLRVPPGGMSFDLSPKGNSTSSEVQNVVIPEIRTLFESLNSDIQLDHIVLYTESASPSAVLNSEYSGAVRVASRTRIPLEFDPGTDFTIDIDFSRLGISEEFDITSYDLPDCPDIQVEADVVNAIPISFSIDFNTQSAVEISLTPAIKAGTSAAPVTTPVVASLKMNNTHLYKEMIDYFRASIRVKVESDESVKISADQNVDLKIKSITLPNGITI